MKGPLWWRRLKARLLPARHLQIVEGDSLPGRIPFRDVVLARDGNEDWCVGLRCPCGCGETIELLLIREAAPRWDLNIDAKGLTSLKPSVWLKKGCRSHFWLIRGRVHWCD
ncbi:DUF6527 family protein [Acidiferrobacter sp.]|uniref:DUF6527 family protein n=1 Tax=Acidiferrobacter sp. TaxID=1872107 RepID=UPI00343B5DB7